MNTLQKTTLVRATAMLLLFVALIVTLGAIAPATEAADEPTRVILTIGDSFTEGFNRNLTLANTQASYRLPLGYLLKTYAKSFGYTFIGPNTGGSPYDNTLNKYPSTVTKDVSVNTIKHFGWAGETTQTIIDNFKADTKATSWKASNKVVVLIQAGTNDVRLGTTTAAEWTTQIGQLLTYLKNEREKGNEAGETTIFLANIIPVNNPDEDGDDSPSCVPKSKVKESEHIFQNFAVPDVASCTNLKNKNIEPFNNALRDWCKPVIPIAGNHSGKCTGDFFKNLGVDVYFVDQWSFAWDYKQTLGDVLSGGKDNIHPNMRGEGLMALRWYWALKDAKLVEATPTGFCDIWFGTGKLNEPCLTHPSPYEGPCEEAPGNRVANCGFSNGKVPWRFWSDQPGRFAVSTSYPYTGRTTAKVSIAAPGKNVQLYQSGIVLEPKTTYELSFAAYSSNDRDMKVMVHKHNEPYTNYGLANSVVDLGTGWKLYTINFTTPDQASMFNARLRFWFAPYATAGTVYYIDEVELVRAP